MKAKYLLTLMAAMLLQFTTVKADVYTDGVMKLLDNGGMGFSAGLTGSLDKAPNVNVDWINNEMKPTLAEKFATYYRQNMSEKEFTQMIDYVLKPEYLAIEKKVMEGTKTTDFQNLIPPSAMQALFTGGTPEAVQMPDCDAQLLKEVRHYMESNHISEASAATMSAMKDIIVNQLAATMPAEQKDQMMAMFNRLFDYIGDNMGAIFTNEIVKSASLEEVKTLNAIENEPFFPAYQKSNDAMFKDIKPILQSLLQNIFKK